MAGMLSDMFGGDAEGSNHVVPTSSLDGDNAGDATNVPDSGNVDEVQPGDEPIASFGTPPDGSTDGEGDGGFGLTPGLNEAQQDSFDYGV